MKTWQTGLLLLFLCALSLVDRYLVSTGKLSNDGFIDNLILQSTGAALLFFLFQVGERALRALGVRKIGSEKLQPDAGNVKRGRMRFRLAWVAGSALLAVSFFYVARPPLMHATSSFTSLAFAMGILGFGLYMFYACVYFALYSFAYTDTHLTALGRNLRARSHRWDDIIGTSSGNECRIIEFRHSGKARIPNYCAGRDELMAFAESKLNDARTPRS